MEISRLHQNDGLSASRTRYRRGMVVGKFCPLHLGHMHLIQTAIDACDEVLVISYTKPEFTGLARTRRESWLRELYPGVRSLVIDDASLGDLCASRGLPRHTLPHNDEDAAVRREFTAWLCEAICDTTVDAVFTSEDYGDGFALALSASFGKRFPGIAPVRHVCVDPARVALPVSGTRIRDNPDLYREFMHPSVYASFVKRICLLGGESSGKTTLARALARRLDTQ